MSMPKSRKLLRYVAEECCAHDGDAEIEVTLITVDCRLGMESISVLQIELMTLQKALEDDESVRKESKMRHSAKNSRVVLWLECKEKEEGRMKGFNGEDGQGTKCSRYVCFFH